MLIQDLHPTPIDERRDLIVPGDNTATLIFCAEHFVAIAQNAVKDHGFFSVALSGGSTPKALFERLASPPFQEMLPWNKMHLFWSDERAVLPSDADSNYHMAMEAGFKKMPIPSSQVHRMQAEQNIEKNAEQYEKTIKEVLQGRPFDLMMLGMGDDGHTASLFPHTKGLKIEDRLALANFIPQKNTWRMSLSFPCINHSSTIAVYALGASKKFMLAKVLLSPLNFEELPAQKIGTKEHKALWIADEAAADIVLSEQKKR